MALLECAFGAQFGNSWYNGLNSKTLGLWYGTVSISISYPCCSVICQQNSAGSIFVIDFETRNVYESIYAITYIKLVKKKESIRRMFHLFLFLKRSNEKNTIGFCTRRMLRRRKTNSAKLH